MVSFIHLEELPKDGKNSEAGEPHHRHDLIPSSEEGLTQWFPGSELHINAIFIAKTKLFYCLHSNPAKQHTPKWPHFSYPDIKATANIPVQKVAHVTAWGTDTLTKIILQLLVHPHNDLPADFCLKLQKHHGAIFKITHISVVMIYLDTMVPIAVKFYHLNYFLNEQDLTYIEFWNTINFFPQ